MRYLFALLIALVPIQAQTVKDIHHYRDPRTQQEVNWYIVNGHVTIWGSGEYLCDPTKSYPSCGVPNAKSVTIVPPANFPAVNILWTRMTMADKETNSATQQTSYFGLQIKLADGTTISGVAIRDDVGTMTMRIPGIGFPVLWLTNNWNYYQVMGFYLEGELLP